MPTPIYRGNHGAIAPTTITQMMRGLLYLIFPINAIAESRIKNQQATRQARAVEPKATRQAHILMYRTSSRKVRIAKPTATVAS